MTRRHAIRRIILHEVVGWMGVVSILLGALYFGQQDERALHAQLQKDARPLVGILDDGRVTQAESQAVETFIAKHDERPEFLATLRDADTRDNAYARNAHRKDYQDALTAYVDTRSKDAYTVYAIGGILVAACWFLLMQYIIHRCLIPHTKNPEGDDEHGL